jgi:sugar phosphate isomerase/epimerase
MKKTTRRRFLRNSGTALASATLLGQLPLGMLAGCAAAKPRSFGFQVWTIREKLVADFPSTLKGMAAMGYTEVEMCSPLGYSDSGFAPLHRMEASEMKQIISDAGLKCTSSHFNMGELREHLDNRIGWAQTLGMKQMVASSFWLPRDAVLDDYRKAAQEINGIGEKTKAAGIQMGFHNHFGEFEKLDGTLVYDVLMEEFDPELVKMQLHMAVVNMGFDPADLFRKYPGRFISSHLSDWSADLDKQVPIGQGVVDWEDFFRAAKTGGVKNVFVEMDPEYFEESAEFLKKI